MTDNQSSSVPEPKTEPPQEGQGDPVERGSIRPTLAELVGYVRADHPGAGPLELLSEATQYAETLGQLSDALIGHHVDAARAAGASWAQIGERLGVSRQGAQQRFVPREPVDLDSLTQAPFFSRLTARGRSALAAAREAARERGHVYVGTEHILLGAARDRDCVAAMTLIALGIPYVDLVRAVDRRVPVGTKWFAEQVPFTPRARKALNLALSVALELGHSYVGTEHLLLSLRVEGESIAAQVLDELGVSADALRAQVLRLLTGYGVTSTQDARPQIKRQEAAGTDQMVAGRAAPEGN